MGAKQGSVKPLEGWFDPRWPPSSVWSPRGSLKHSGGEGNSPHRCVKGTITVVFYLIPQRPSSPGGGGQKQRQRQRSFLTSPYDTGGGGNFGWSQIQIGKFVQRILQYYFQFFFRNFQIIFSFLQQVYIFFWRFTPKLGKYLQKSFEINFQKFPEFSRTKFFRTIFYHANPPPCTHDVVYI